MYSRQNEVVNGIDDGKSLSSLGNTFVVLYVYQAPSGNTTSFNADIFPTSTHTSNEFALENGSSAKQFLPTLNRY